MKIALVHDWLTGMRGGEKVLEVFCELFPSADVFTLVHVPGSVSATIENHRITTSWLQKIPGIAQRYRYALPLMPSAVESLDLSDYDLVISSSHCVAKGCRPRQGAMHICYCHTPMRYLWDQFDHYFGPGRASLPVRCAMSLLRPGLRKWDVLTAARVDQFAANSEYVRARIHKHYGRDSTVIHPPADTDFYSPGPAGAAGGYDLIVSAFAPYKRLDIAIQVYNRLKRPLVIIGSGQDEKKLKSLAGGTVEFLGWRPDEELREHYRACRALIFPGTEDYGIVPLEAMACGRPVIAYGAGGILETVEEGRTGIFFKESSPEALISAVQESEKIPWDPQAIRDHALNFSREKYKARLKGFLLEKTRSRFDLTPHIS